MKYLSIAVFSVSAVCFAGATAKVAYYFLWSPGFWAPRLVVAEKIHDLGSVPADDHVPCKFAIRNAGSGPLTITEVKPGCGGCVEILSYPTRPLDPGQQGNIEVALLTKKLSGRVQKQLAVRSNDPRRPTMVLTIQAHVKSTNSVDAS